MGSGHFLVEAVDFITDRLLTFLNQFPINPVTFMLDRTRRNILEALGERGVAVDPDKLTEVNLLKRHVLKRCIYGVDLNPMAVELAKVEPLARRLYHRRTALVPRPPPAMRKLADWRDVQGLGSGHQGPAIQHRLRATPPGNPARNPGQCNGRRHGG